ncbi:Trm112 family protein [Fretibacter rubidus]|uniref:Trm112 family protein n=1 Tax=Fretibacter rubidus TaxID=570162 RepID=UPI00352B3385
MIDPKLIGALVCPKTRGPITYDRVHNELVSKKAKLAFPIREGVPIMLVEEARSLEN